MPSGAYAPMKMGILVAVAVMLAWEVWRARR
jgi:hypothetical protein